jgi:hypothetical protein
MYTVKLINDNCFLIDNVDYERIINALNNQCNFIEITSRYEHFNSDKVLLNLKYILCITEE